LQADANHESLAFSRDETLLYAGARYANVVAVSLVDGTRRSILSDARLESLSLSADGSSIAIPVRVGRRENRERDACGVIQIWDDSLTKLKATASSTGDGARRCQLTVANLSADGRLL